MKVLAANDTVCSMTKMRAATKTVLEAQAPAFSTQQAEAIARRAFGIEASAHPLASERDQNFQLRAKDGSEWVLKIANAAENPALLDMQTQAPALRSRTHHIEEQGRRRGDSRSLRRGGASPTQPAALPGDPQ